MAIRLPAQESTRTGTRTTYRDWKAYGGTPDNVHYSALTQINRDNVQHLTEAWRYDAGDASQGSEMECNPIIVDNVLYATTPTLRVIALNAATGKMLWTFDPTESTSRGRGLKADNRGVAYWSSGSDQRIFTVARNNLWAVNAKTGKAIPSFGDEGHVDLRQGLGRDPDTVSITSTSPGRVYKDLFILGSTVPEDLPSAPGDIRAFDVRTGKVRWTFHTIPHPGEFGYDTWPKDAWKTSGGANDWGGMTLDEQRGMLFIPTGSAAADPYGADRHGDDLFANCLIALHADTGKLAWYFQAVKHDIWDRDFPAPPALITVKRGNRLIDAVAITTKSSTMFVFDRDTGKSLFPIEYRKVPSSDIDGEQTSPTQPFPVLPEPFAPQAFTEDIVTDRTPRAHQYVLDELKKYRHGGQFIPPSLQGTIVFPGLDGGGEWGGGAFDPATHLFYVNSDSMVSVIRLIERPKREGLVTGRTLYMDHCATCHGQNFAGDPPHYPALTQINRKMSEIEISAVIKSGGALMPAFAQLGDPAIHSIAEFVLYGRGVAVAAPRQTVPRLKYMRGAPIRVFDPDGYPPMKTPWGTLNAINMDTGKLVWQVPLGEFPELMKQGLPVTGSDNYGGPLVTAGGLIFIGASNHDQKFRAFDKASGKVVWEAKLPAGGNATPATYEIDGRQYVVIAAGGGKSHLGPVPSAATYVAFALPAKAKP
ncbi:MAG TPA: PQQ-binding-like beta-propeller repeat protein [Bryobacteraceae bacterium]|nr:PQQ-binding-like beta-propeller repeat protein [Bryobacteraceae bacterium]